MKAFRKDGVDDVVGRDSEHITQTKAREALAKFAIVEKKHFIAVIVDIGMRVLLRQLLIAITGCYIFSLQGSTDIKGIVSSIFGSHIIVLYRRYLSL